jgi:hypothetical protein
VGQGLHLLREAHARGERVLAFSDLEGCTYEAPLEQRHECFLKSGVVCAGCGLHAAFFAWEWRERPERQERQESGEWTLSLYGEREGTDVYFTKDHIWPRSRGGANALDNYQTMCWPCNSRKGNAMGWDLFDPSFALDRPDWERARAELQARGSSRVAWCWDAFEPGPKGPLTQKWPIETRPFVNVPCSGWFLYSSQSERLYTNLRYVYGVGDQPGELRGNTTLFRDPSWTHRGASVEVELTEMIPLRLRGVDLGDDLEALARSWQQIPSDAYLFSLLCVECEYERHPDETHWVLYTPLPPHRVVELLLTPMAIRPEYVLDTGRSGAWNARGPGTRASMGDWVQSEEGPRYLLTPEPLSPGWERVSQQGRFPWPIVLDQTEPPVKLYRRAGG